MIEGKGKRRGKRKRGKNAGLSEPYRPRAGLFGPPGPYYHCAGCGQKWDVRMKTWRCPFCGYGESAP